MVNVGLTQAVVEDWKGIVENKNFAAIKSDNRKRTLIQLFENSVNHAGTFENPSAVKAAARKASKMLTEAPALATTSPVGTAGSGLAPAIQTSGATTGNPGDGTGLAGYDPIMIAMIRRSQPVLVAYDLVGVQPMTGPSGMIFALHARAVDNVTGAVGDELFALRNAAQAAAIANAGGGNVNASLGLAGSVFGSTILHAGGQPGGQFASGVLGGPNAADTAIQGGIGGQAARITTQQGETLGTVAGPQWKRATMTISRVTVTAGERALMAEFTDEVVQDMKNLNGLDAEAELSNILATEIAWEQNRELIDIIRYVAKPYHGGSVDVTTSQDNFGAFGFAERAKAVLFHIERAANEIARDTRRGKANWVLVSSDVATLLHLAQVITVNPELKTTVETADDASGSLELGTLLSGIKVVLDPYANLGSVVVGYKGKTPLDSGFFWCPYVPLQKMAARDPNTFQPRIAFKTRYGIGANPHGAGFLTADGGANVQQIGNNQGLAQNSNAYYRFFSVSY